MYINIDSGRVWSITTRQDIEKAPVSAILYKCKVLETDIPYEYQDRNLVLKALMKISLMKRYDPEAFTFDVLKEDYGIYAVRGPRGVPYSLSQKLG